MLRFSFSSSLLFVSGMVWGLLLQGFGSDNSIQVQTSISPKEITVGDVVTVKVVVSHPATAKIVFPTLESSWGEWVVRTKRLTPPPSNQGVVQDAVEIELTIYRIGEFDIPSLSLEAVMATGERSTLRSEAGKVSVRSVLNSKDESLKEIKPQAEIAPDYKPFFFLLAALASAAYLVYLLIRKLKRRAKPEAPLVRDTRTPEEIAREAIRQLLARKLIESGMFKAFYFELSEIIKRFLGVKLHIPSLERTTREFTRDLRSTAIGQDQYASIRDFLESCDLVKFAKYRPTTEEIEAAVRQADDLIGKVGNAVVMEVEVNR